MATWKYAAALATLGISATAHAQSGVDWSGLMMTEAMGSATEEAAREGTTAQSTPRKRSAASGSPDQARADCARVRGWIAEGRQDPALPQLAGLCRQLGY